MICLSRFYFPLTKYFHKYQHLTPSSASEAKGQTPGDFVDVFFFYSGRGRIGGNNMYLSIATFVSVSVEVYIPR